MHHPFWGGLRKMGDANRLKMHGQWRVQQPARESRLRFCWVQIAIRELEVVLDYDESNCGGQIKRSSIASEQIGGYLIY